MALSPAQQAKLRGYFVEYARTQNSDVLEVVFAQLWPAYFETAAERKIRAQVWITAVRALRAADLASADAAHAARKAAVTAQVAELDTINGSL
jgi:hypothetical protein